MENQQKRKYTRWTFDTIINEAKKYKSRSEFSRGSQRAYLIALKAGMIPHLFPIEDVLQAARERQAELLAMHPIQVKSKHLSKLQKHVALKDAELNEADWQHVPESIKQKVWYYIEHNVRTQDELDRDIADKIWLDDYGQACEDYFAAAGREHLSKNV